MSVFNDTNTREEGSCYRSISLRVKAKVNAWSKIHIRTEINNRIHILTCGTHNRAMYMYVFIYIFIGVSKKKKIQNDAIVYP